MKYRTNIEPIMLVGDRELGQAIGIHDREALAKLRASGMPYGKIGKSFVYFPDKVKKWLIAKSEDALKGKKLKQELYEII